jgi:integrase
MNLSDLLDRYSVLNNLTDKTITLYHATLARFTEFLRAESGNTAYVPTTGDLDDLVVSKFLRWRAKTSYRGKVVKPASVLKDRTQLVALWNFAAKKRLAAEFPALAKMRVSQRVPRAYTSEDVAKLIITARRRPRNVGGKPAAWWWSTLIYTAYCTAERISALLSLRWSEVDLEQCRVTFLADTRKGHTRDIVREITPDLAKLMLPYRGRPDELVWHWDRRRNSIWTSLQLLCGRAGVKYRGFHGFRKAAASYTALKHGRAAATALLDHSNPRLAELYVDPSICPPERTSVESLPVLDLAEPINAASPTAPPHRH